MASSSSSSSNTEWSAEAEIAELRRKVESLMNDRVAPAVSELAGRAEGAAQHAVSTARRESERVGQAVRDQPIAALAIAAAAGFLVALLARR